MRVRGQRHARASSRVASLCLVASLVGATLAGIGPASPAPAAGLGGPMQVEEPDSPEDYVDRGVTTLLAPGSDFPYSQGRVAISDDGRFVAFEVAEEVDCDDGFCPPPQIDVYLVDRDADGDGFYDSCDTDDCSPFREHWVSGLDGAIDEPDGSSYETDISADGRWVVFTSRATNIDGDGGDQSGDEDVFLWDRLDPTAPAIWVSANKPVGNSGADAGGASISDAGDRVAYHNDCLQIDLRQAAVPSDCGSDVLVQDIPVTNGEQPEAIPRGQVGLELAGESHSGAVLGGDGASVVFVAQGCPAEGEPGCDDEEQVLGRYEVAADEAAPVDDGGHTDPAQPSVSADGNAIAFRAVGESTFNQIYVLDRTTGSVDLVSFVGNEPGRGNSFDPAISSDGRYVAYATLANNLFHRSGSQIIQVVVRDRMIPAAENELVSVAFEDDGESAVIGDAPSIAPAVSSNRGFTNGQPNELPLGLPFVAFPSLADNLHPFDDDTTHDVLVRSFTSAAFLNATTPVDFGDVATSSTRLRSVDMVAAPFGFGPVVATRVLFEPDQPEFSLRLLECPAVQPGGTCSVVVAFSPTDVGGTVRDTMVLESDSNPAIIEDGGDEESDQAVRPVVGRGVLGGLVFNPTVVSFGTETIGTTSGARTVEVSILGDPADEDTFVSFSSITVSGPAPSDYRLDVSDCLTRGVRPREPCTVTVAFGPTAVGDRPAVIEFRRDAAAPPDLVLVRGAGAQPTIIVNPAVTRSGTVVVVNGTRWPPGSQVAIAVQFRPGTVVATTGPDGTFHQPVVVFRNNNFGPLTVDASVVGNPAIASPVQSLLVQAPTVNPGDFVNRR